MTSIATSVSGMMGQPAPQGVGGLSALSMSGFMAKESLLSNVAKPALLGFKIGGAIGGAIGGGFAEKYALKTQARDAELQAKQEELNALSQQNFFQESLIENFAQQTAKLAARGILTTGPSAYAFAGRSARNVTRDIEAAKYSGKIRSEQNKREASSFRSASKQAVKSSIGKAFSFLAGEL
jgi:hypothetical protein